MESHNLEIIWSHTYLNTLKHAPTHSHTHPLTQLIFHASRTFTLTHSFIHARTYARTHSLIHSFTHSLIHSFTHSIIHTFTQSYTHSLIHSFTHSIIQSFTHAHTHARFTYPRTHAPIRIHLFISSSLTFNHTLNLLNTFTLLTHHLYHSILVNILFWKAYLVDRVHAAQTIS